MALAINDTEETICILLASYNGEKYIDSQLDSLLTQSYSNWQLFIRDDGSSDQTIGIINQYVAKDHRITLVQDNLGNLGSCQNFAMLIKHTTDKFNYYMFADQDDVWLPKKIEETFDEMLRVQNQVDDDRPLMIYTNFVYVDETLHVIESKRKHSSTKVANLKFSHLLAQNPAHGCTMMVNRSLLQLVPEIPSVAENHDFWIALVAAAFGGISYLKAKTILYRQHSSNISTNYDNNTFSKRFKRIFVEKKILEDVKLKGQMALAFRDVYFAKLADEKKDLISNFIGLYTNKSLLLISKNIKNGVRRQTFSQTVLFYLAILLLKRVPAPQVATTHSNPI